MLEQNSISEGSPVIPALILFSVTYVFTILLLSTILLLITASFIPNKPAITNGLICMALFVIGLIYRKRISRHS